MYRSWTPTYRSWVRMIKRCSDPKNNRYYRYGARGIKVCDRWLLFENFFADMGERPPGKQIDRINNDGNYEPSNCRWATRIEQARNKSNNTVVQVGKTPLTLAEWSEKTGVERRTISYRVNSGWAAENLCHHPADLLSTGEMAKVLNVGRSTVCRWMANGKLKAMFVSPGGHRFFKRP